MITPIVYLFIGFIQAAMSQTIQNATMPYFLQISNSEAQDQYYKIYGNSWDLTKQQLEDVLRKWAKEQGEEVSVSCFTLFRKATSQTWNEVKEQKSFS